MTYRCLSLHQPWATFIAQGVKLIETRRWATTHRGQLLICSSKKPSVEGHFCGYGLALANMIDCRPMREADWRWACCEPYAGAYGWVFDEVTRLDPFPVKGSQGLFGLYLEREPAAAKWSQNPKSDALRLAAPDVFGEVKDDKA